MAALACSAAGPLPRHSPRKVTNYGWSTRHTVAELCLLAGSKIKSVPVQCSFAAALAYSLEVDHNRRTAAKRVWKPYESLTPQEWDATEFEQLFLEANVGSRASGASMADDVQELQLIWDQSRHDASPEAEYLAYRQLALGYTAAGHLDEALSYYDQAITCGQFLEATAKLILLGDLLWLALRIGRTPKQRQAVDGLIATLESVRPYIGNVAIFARCAMLCGAASAPAAEWRFVAQIASCLR